MPERRGCIAIVDDDAGMCKALERLLRSFGFEARSFDSAEEFLVKANEQNDCLVLDIKLPGMSGPELLHRLESEGKRLPTVFITALQRNWVSEYPNRIGHSICLQKPFSDSLLIGSVNAALGSASPEEPSQLRHVRKARRHSESL